MAYIASDWYWSGSYGIYGSARNGLVTDPANDTAYQAFLAHGNIATASLSTTAELDEVLAAAGLPVSGLSPLTKDQLNAYANARNQAVLAVARAYQIDAAGGSPEVTVKSDTTTATGADLMALYIWGSANPSSTQSWVDNFGVVTQMSGAQLVALALAVRAYGALCYEALAAASTAINSGSITTTAQIDALTWPA